MIALLLALLALAHKPGPAQQPGPAREPEPAQRDDCQVAPRAGTAALAERLGALAERRADRVRAFSCGRSEEGREIWVVALTDLGTGPPSQKPGLLCVPDLDAPPESAASALVEMACRLVERADTDPAVAALLARTSLYVLPLPDPDARARALGETSGEPSEHARAIALDRSFPAGWDPWRFGPLAGPYPLARAESRALARFLVARRNVAAVARLKAGGPGGEARPAQLGPEDGGSLLAFVEEDLEQAAFEAGVLGNAGAERAAGVALSLLEGLPQVELERVAVTRLKADLVQVDLLVQNAAAPAVGGEPRPHALARGLRLAAEGADVLAAAVRGDRREAFEVLAGDPTELVLGDVPAAGRIEVRLVVRASEPPAPLVVRLTSERGGGDRLDVQLVR